LSWSSTWSSEEDTHADHLFPRHHNLARSEVRELEQAADGVFFEAFKVAFGAAGGDDELQLLHRVSAAVCFAVDAETGGDEVSRALNGGDEWAGDPRKDEQYGRDEDGQFIGRCQGYVLRHHLAEDDMEERHDGEGCRDGDTVEDCRGGGRHHGLQPADEHLKERIFAGPAQAETGQRHPDLRYAQHPFRVFEHAERHLGAAFTFVGQGLQARLPHR
jgi:hypothetical protein